MPNHGWGIARYTNSRATAAHPFDNVPDLPCRDEPERWFPEPSDPGGRGKAAQEQCRTQCPIRQACLAFALDTGQWFGTWGGVSAGKRSDMTDEVRAAAIAAGADQLSQITRAREREYRADGRRTA